MFLVMEAQSLKDTFLKINSIGSYQNIFFGFCNGKAVFRRSTKWCKKTVKYIILSLELFTCLPEQKNVVTFHLLRKVQ